jgi:hypothetical protein
MILGLCSCNKVQRIQKNSNDIHALAQASKENYEGIIEAAKAHPARVSEIVERSNQGISQQTQIIEKTKDTILQTSEVVDSVPQWVSTLELGLWTVLACVIFIGLWYLGVGTLTKRIFGFIPEAKKEQAKLLTEALDKQSPTELREVIAYLRAKDPELNAAYKEIKHDKIQQQ